MEKKQMIGRTVIYGLLLLGAITMLLPFIWMVLSSLKTQREIIAMPPKIFPANPQWGNYQKAFEMAPFARFFFNSLIVTVFGVLLQVFLTILMAFTFSRLHFPGRDVIFSLLIGLMMVPYEMLIITNYSTISQLNLIDTYLGIFLPSSASVYYAYILRNFFLGIPDSLYYSAKLDGASDWKYLWRIMIVLAKPALITIVLLNTIGLWNTFLWPLIVTNVESMRTVQVGLNAFTNESGTRYDLLMAATTVVLLPMLVLFIFERKFIVTAVSSGGTKG
ncbi:MAG: carbohydrate ABC transporter permease [Sphaerochaetaceae bacterium]|nr:carbohydrate ABC transporter permease [Sphaerochaetaceae bacterium]